MKRKPSQRLLYGVQAGRDYWCYDIVGSLAEILKTGAKAHGLCSRDCFYDGRT